LTAGLDDGYEFVYSIVMVDKESPRSTGLDDDSEVSAGLFLVYDMDHWEHHGAYRLEISMKRITVHFEVNVMI
jgi:hypothetical protein